jgi:hypothetical protein
MTDGEEWKKLRRFSLSTLKEFGFGKQGMEAIIKDEVEEFLANFAASEEDTDTLIKFPFNISIFNIIWRIVAGKRFEASLKLIMQKKLTKHACPKK